MVLGAGPLDKEEVEVVGDYLKTVEEHLVENLTRLTSSKLGVEQNLDQGLDKLPRGLISERFGPWVSSTAEKIECVEPYLFDNAVVTSTAENYCDKIWHAAV